MPKKQRLCSDAADWLAVQGHPADALLSPDQIGARQEELQQAGPGRGGYSRRGGQDGPG